MASRTATTAVPPPGRDGDDYDEAAAAEAYYRHQEFLRQQQYQQYQQQYQQQQQYQPQQQQYQQYQPQQQQQYDYGYRDTPRREEERERQQYEQYYDVVGGGGDDHDAVDSANDGGRRRPRGQEQPQPQQPRPHDRHRRRRDNHNGGGGGVGGVGHLRPDNLALTERMRRKTRRSLGDGNRMEEARRAGQFASLRVLGSLQAAAAAAEAQSPSYNGGPAAAATGGKNNNKRNSTFPSASSVLPQLPSFDTSVDSSRHSEPFLVAQGGGSGSGVGGAVQQQQDHQQPQQYYDPSERAVRRGSRRGMQEPAEDGGAFGYGAAEDDRFYDWYDDRRRGGRSGGGNIFRRTGREPNVGDVDSEFGVTTTLTGGAGTEFTTSPKRGSKMQKRRSGDSIEPKKDKASLLKFGLRNRKKKGASLDGAGGMKKMGRDGADDSSDGDDDAYWMCGVCGKAFSDIDIASQHENWHVREVVAGLGWADIAATSAGSDPGQSDVHNVDLDGFLDTQTPTAGTPATENGRDGGARGGTAAFFPSPSGDGGSRRARTVSEDSMFFSPPPRRPVATREPDREGIVGFQDPPVLRAFQSARLRAAGLFGDSDQDLRQNQPTAEGADEFQDATATNLREDSRQLQGIHNLDGAFSSELPVGALVPKPRARTFSEVRFDESGVIGARGRGIAGRDGGDRLLLDSVNENKKIGAKSSVKGDVVLMPNAMREYVVLSDEALVEVCQRAKPLILTDAEMKAERELAFLARDKAYYDEIAQRAFARRKNPSNRFRADSETFAGKVQNKMLDAYQLMKEGDNTRGVTDHYEKKQKSGGDGAASQEIMIQSDKTLYVNVMVKNSIQVVRHELERLAREKWETSPEEVNKFTKFQRFRVYAHVNIVKLAGIALASDFTVR